MRYQIWYMRPAFFSDGILEIKRPDPANLLATHIHLKDIEAHGLDEAFSMMQAERWSPNGEARELIKSKGLQHTSMSIGDVIIDDVRNVHVVSGIGFKALGGARFQTPGQIAYETELLARPSYDDGSPRNTWDQLDDLTRSTWEKNPTPRWEKK